MIDKQKVGLAAAVGAAAVAPAAQAAIVYTPGPLPVSSSSSQAVDFNHDGVSDIVVNVANTNSINLSKPVSATKQDYVADPVNSGYVAALPAGEAIDNSDSYGTVGIDEKTLKSNVPPLITDNGNGTTTGGFTVAAGEQFVGMRLTLPDGGHFAWIGFQTTNESDGSMAGTITGYAYETAQNTPIAAGNTVPEPTSMALLALGAAGLLRYRGRSRFR